MGSPLCPLSGFSLRYSEAGDLDSYLVLEHALKMTVGSSLRKWLDFRPTGTDPPRTTEAWGVLHDECAALRLPQRA
jgi:hypothetical protein